MSAMPGDGRTPDSLGERNTPIGGGQSDYLQFRRHFSAELISLRRRLLAGQEGRSAVHKINASEVDGIMWDAVNLMEFKAMYRPALYSPDVVLTDKERKLVQDIDRAYADLREKLRDKRLRQLAESEKMAAYAFPTLKDLEERASLAREEAKAIKRELASADRSRQEIQRQLDTYHFALGMTNEDIKRLTTRLDNNKASRREHQAKLNRVEGQAQELLSQPGFDIKKATDLLADVKELRAQVQEIDFKIEYAMDELKALRTDQRNLTSTITKLKEQLAKVPPSAKKQKV